jgi:hypothetical protein
MGVTQLHKLKNAPPYEVHLVWGYGQREGKLYKLRDLGLGYDPPEYYTAGRYMSFDMVLPSVPEGFSKWAQEGPYMNKREVRRGGGNVGRVEHVGLKQCTGS